MIITPEQQIENVQAVYLYYLRQLHACGQTLRACREMEQSTVWRWGKSRRLQSGWLGWAFSALQSLRQLRELQRQHAAGELEPLECDVTFPF